MTTVTVAPARVRTFRAPLAVVGVALAIGGGFLPWFDSLGGTVSAWQLPAQRLVSGTSSGVTVGPFLLVTAIALLPILVRRPLPMVLTVLAGAVAVNAGVMAIVLALRSGPGVTPGIGTVLTVVGGFLVIFGAVRVWPLARRTR